eukprot:2826733-Rhodomonas_salina.2
MAGDHGVGDAHVVAEHAAVCVHCDGARHTADHHTTVRLRHRQTQTQTQDADTDRQRDRDREMDRDRDRDRDRDQGRDREGGREGGGGLSLNKRLCVHTCDGARDETLETSTRRCV